MSLINCCMNGGYLNLKTVISKISVKENEQVTIECVEVTQEIMNLKSYAEGVGNSIAGTIDGKMTEASLSDILYFEAVDESVFAYLEKDVMAVKGRLYEYEKRLSEKGFVRISKSILLHLNKVENIRPALNRKFIAELSNGEQVMISRQYVKPLKEVLFGGKANEL